MNDYLSAPPPFSRLITVDSVPDSGLNLKLAATAEEAAAVAKLDGIVGLRDLLVEVEILPRGRQRVIARGRVTATATQTCVVTLTPFDSRIDEMFEVEFAPEAEAEAAYLRAMAEIEAALDKAAALAEQPDPPDPIINGKIDVGSLASEFLALGLDAYPRKPGAQFQNPDGEPDDEKASPFAALARFKKDEPTP